MDLGGGPGLILGGSVLEGGQPQLLTRRPQGFDVFDLCFDFGEVTHFVLLMLVDGVELRNGCRGQ
jgi:hypothetical protein